MGTCKYCGKSAGIFSSKHKECERLHQNALQLCNESLTAFFNGNKDINLIKEELPALKTEKFLTNEEFEEACRQALTNYRNAVNFPITKENLQTIDSFVHNIGVPANTLNKNGELTQIALHFYKGILISYFTRNEPIDKVKKRAEMVTQLLPLSAQQMHEAQLDVLDSAANIFLADSLIDDQEEKQLDEFTFHLNVSLAQIPPRLANGSLAKLPQAFILRDLKAGRQPQPMNVSLPIMLGAGEFVIWLYNNVTFLQEKVHKEWVGRSHGTSVRIAKGVYYRTGGSRGVPVEYSTLDKQGIGYFILTNKNIIFYSQTKSTKIPYKKIIAVTPYSDGIEIQKDAATAKREIYQGFDSWFTVNFLSYINV